MSTSELKDFLKAADPRAMRPPALLPQERPSDPLILSAEPAEVSKDGRE